MKPRSRSVGFDSIPTELLPQRSHRMAHTVSRRRRIDLWATGGTIVIGLSLFLVASLFYAPPSTGAPSAQSETTATDHSDLALAEEFIVTADDQTIPAEVEAVSESMTPVSTAAPERAPLSFPAPEPALPVVAETPTPEAQANADTPPPSTQPDLLRPDISEPALTLPQEAFRLSQLPPASLRFDDEPLETAITMIADSADMSYATSGVLEGQVTGSLVGNPYRLLKNLSKAYAFDMEYDNGLWTFSSSRSRTAAQSQRILTTRTYQITNNMLERLTVRETLGGLGGSGGSGGGGFGTGGGGGLGGSTSRMASANLLAGRTVFEADYERMITDLQQLLNATNPSKDGPQSTVFLNEDGNSLLAVGTEEDHKLIAAYMANFDKPQRAVALEVKLIRTKRNPSSLVGVDWSNGVAVDLSGTFDEGKFTLEQLVGGLGGNPTGVILTNSEAKITFDAIKNDSMTKRISYIEKMTLDNREAVLANVVEEPVISDREEIDSESGLRVLLSIEKEIIGTVINILPRITQDDNIKMRLRLEDSNIVRFKQFFEGSGGEYPVISKQTYEGPVVVKDGYSLAITGFETTEEVLTKSSVPLLGDIPLVGKAFGRERTQEERSYLVVFITPRILPDTTSGVDYLNRSHHLGRAEPLGPIAGTHFDSFRDLERYVSGIRRQHDEMMQQASVRGVTSELIDEANFLYGELEALSGQLQSFFDRGVETRKATNMLDFCDTALSNTWRILQQRHPPYAASPKELVQHPGMGPSTVYQTAKTRFKSQSTRKRSRFFNRRKGH